MNVERVKEALTPDHHSAFVYCGRIVQREAFSVFDKDGNEIHAERDVVITRKTIEAVLEMVRERAAI